MVALRLSEIAAHIDASLIGDPDFLIDGIASIELAEATQICFLTKKQFEKYLESSKAGAVILKQEIQDCSVKNQLIVDDPYLAYAKLTACFDDRPVVQPGIHPSATIDPTAKLAENVAIGPHCVIEAGASIGANSQLTAGVFIGRDSVVGESAILHPNVTVYHKVHLGKRVRIHSGTTIGSDGFGFAPSHEGWVKIHQLGGVTIGDDVEIGSGTSIDRGALTDTQIASGVIIDNQVHIAHNVVVGANTAIAGCVGIAGSAVVGENCTMGGFVAINGHVSICDNVHLHGGTIVTKSIKEPGTYACGTPTQDVKLWRKNAVRFGQLDDWVTRIKKLEEKTG